VQSPCALLKIPIDVPASHDIAKVQDLMVQTMLSGESSDERPRSQDGYHRSERSKLFAFAFSQR